MKLISGTSSLLLAATIATVRAVPLDSRAEVTQDTSSLTFFNGTCTAETVTVRKEWRTLTNVEKQAYIDAELCLLSLPGQTGLPGALDRFADLQAVHQVSATSINGDTIHYVGQFLPFHRYFMHVHEELLRNECNYTGTLPWWDEAMDAATGNFFSSPMWDAELGFGGNGTEPDNCVMDGPFGNRTIHVGPLLTTSDYCFKRNWNNTLGVQMELQSNVDACYEFNDYASFWDCLRRYPHVGGHAATGGLMADIDASPGDPTFYLHHVYVDRLWWQWQALNATSRMYDMSGYTTQYEPADGWVNTTLDYVMSTYEISPNVTIEEIMNVQGGYLCYEFDY